MVLGIMAFKMGNPKTPKPHICFSIATLPEGYAFVPEKNQLAQYRMSANRSIDAQFSVKPQPKNLSKKCQLRVESTLIITPLYLRCYIETAFQ